MEKLNQAEKHRSGIRTLIEKTLRDLRKEEAIPVIFESLVVEMQSLERQLRFADFPKKCEEIRFQLKGLLYDWILFVGSSENPKHQTVAKRMIGTIEILLQITTYRIKTLNQIYKTCTPTHAGEDDFIFCHRESQTS